MQRSMQMNAKKVNKSRWHSKELSARVKAASILFAKFQQRREREKSSLDLEQQRSQ
jgi:hypothetical protein